MKLHAQVFPCTTAEQAPALVLLHGWGVHSGVWLPVLPALREYFSITVIDLPGFGQSRAVFPAEYSLEACTELLLAVAPARALWLGWSLGGLLALYVAAHFPQRVAGLSLLAATPCFVQRRDWPSAMSPTVFAEFSAAVEAAPAQALSRFAALQCQGAATARAGLRQLQMALDHGAALPALNGGLRLLADSDLRAEFAALQTPLQCLLGAHDALLPVAQVSALREINPRADIHRFEHSAHLPFLSEGAAFVRALRDFSATQVMAP